MTAPDPAWVEAGARASAQWHRNEDAWDSDDRALAYLILTAALPLIREQIAADIEALPIDHRSPGRTTVSGLVTFARREAYLRAAAIARGGAR